uniref:Uncharacterized protein n=2 Tax=Magallana gigas TaxID=29159 RepID=A0A8W8M1Z6_MAGGI
SDDHYRKRSAHTVPSKCPIIVPAPRRENACVVTRARRTGNVVAETSVNAPKHRVTVHVKAKSSAAVLKKNAAAERGATDRTPVNVRPTAAVRRSMTHAQRRGTERKLRRNYLLFASEYTVYLRHGNKIT